MLFWSAVINGALAPPLILLIILLTSNAEVMGERVNPPAMNSSAGLRSASCQRPQSECCFPKLCIPLPHVHRAQVGYRRTKTRVNAFCSGLSTLTVMVPSGASE